MRGGVSAKNRRMIELEAQRLAEYGGERVALAAHDRIVRVRGELAELTLLFEARGATDSTIRAMLLSFDAIAEAYAAGARS